MKFSPRMLAVLTGVVALFSALNFYIGWHGRLLLSRYAPAFPIGVYWVLFAIIAFSFLLARLPGLPNWVGRALKVIGAFYFGFMEFAVLLLLPIDAAAALLRAAGVYEQAAFDAWAGAAFAIVMAALLVRGAWNAWRPIVRTYTLEVDKPAGDRRELTVVVASDIHLGSIVGNRHLGRLIRETEAIRPDLILLPGDVMDEDLEPFVRRRMGDTLRRLRELAPLGAYAVLGNHEYYGGHVDAYIREMEAAGIPVLRDETVKVADALYVVGRKDKTSEGAGMDGRQSYEELLAPLDRTLPIIVMDHQPYEYDQAAAAGADIVLSGHTHRGQFAPNHWVTRRLFELDWGYLRKGKMHAVVSSGFGTWGPPIRLASRSEIVRLLVRFQP